MELIELKLDGCLLRFSTISQEWCKVFLVLFDKEHYLGADRKDVILTKIFNALSKDADYNNGHINGKPVSFVLTLFESHCTVYMSKTDDGRCLYFEDTNGQLITNILLSPLDLESWVTKLETAITNLVMRSQIL